MEYIRLQSIYATPLLLWNNPHLRCLMVNSRCVSTYARMHVCMACMHPRIHPSVHTPIHACIQTCRFASAPILSGTAFHSFKDHFPWDLMTVNLLPVWRQANTSARWYCWLVLLNPNFCRWSMFRSWSNRKAVITLLCVITAASDILTHPFRFPPAGFGSGGRRVGSAEGHAQAGAGIAIVHISSFWYLTEWIA